MSGFSTTNMSESVKIILGSHVAPGNYYVDAINGDDLNDGRTKETAWKTSAKINAFLTNKISSGLIVLYLAEGSYDSLYLQYLNCEGLHIVGAGEDKTFIRSTHNERSVGLVSVTYIIIRGLTLSSSNNGEAPDVLLYANNVKFLETSVVYDGSEMDRGGTAARLDLVSTYFCKSSFKNLPEHSRAISVSLNTNITFYNTYFDKPYVVNIGNGSTIALNELRAGSAEPTIANSVYAHKILNGIVIEEGFNANGKYTKYANGLLMMVRTIDLHESNGTEVTSAIPLPSQFVSMEYTSIELIAIKGGILNADVKTFHDYSQGSKAYLSYVFKDSSNSYPSQASAQVLVIGRWK